MNAARKRGLLWDRARGPCKGYGVKGREPGQAKGNSLSSIIVGSSRIILALGVCALIGLLAFLAGVGDAPDSADALNRKELADSADSPAVAGILPDAQLVEPDEVEPDPKEEATREVIESEPEPRPFEPQVPILFFEEIVEPELEVAGNISGRLISEKGYWLPSEMPERDTLVVELVRLEEPKLERRAQLVVEEAGVEGVEGGLALSFLFEDVPIGDYELSLFNLGSWHWEPRSMSVRAPANGLDFVRYDRDEKLPLVFEVFDAKSGEAIEEFSAAHLEQTVSEQSGVFMHAGPIDTNSFPASARFNWSLWAEGYRASFGDERAFEWKQGRRVARVELTPGWSARLVVLGREPTLRPLYRAEVRVNGRFMGATDMDGALVIALDETPESIEVGYKDWVLENDPFDPRPGTTPNLRGHVVPLILKAPD